MLDDKLYLIGIGLEKAGTSTLFSLLSPIPEIEAPRMKEPHFFFKDSFPKGYRYYNELFSEKTGASVRIDFTPTYGFGAGALRNIRDFDVEKKIIITLRHPIERAFSRYAFRIQHFHRMAVSNAYRDQVVGGPENLQKFFDNPVDQSFFEMAESADNRIVPSYSSLVETAFDLFGKPNVLVLIFEDWVCQDPRYVLEKIAAHTGKKLNYLSPKLPHANPTLLPGFTYRTDPDRRKERYRALIVDGKIHDLKTMEPSIAERLIDAAAFWTDYVPAEQARRLYEDKYADDIVRLEKLLGEDFSIWRRFRDLHYPRQVI